MASVAWVLLPRAALRRATHGAQQEGSAPATDRRWMAGDLTCRGWRGASRCTRAAANEREGEASATRWRRGAPASNGKPAERPACNDGDGRGVSSADRVDGISNTVHPWASFNRRMVDVRARIDWGLQRSAREPSRSSSPGRAGAGAARCAMAEGPGRGLRGSSARQPRRRIKPRTTEEFQTAGSFRVLALVK